MRSNVFKSNIATSYHLGFILSSVFQSIITKTLFGKWEIDAQGPCAIITNNRMIVLVNILYFKFLQRPFSIYLGLFTNTERYQMVQV